MGFSGAPPQRGRPGARPASPWLRTLRGVLPEGAEQIDCPARSVELQMVVVVVGVDFEEHGAALFDRDVPAKRAWKRHEPVGTDRVALHLCPVRNLEALDRD